MLEDRNFIRVMNRDSGIVAHQILPQCHHTFVCLSQHPCDSSFTLEGCPVCEVIRSYNVHTGECNVVHVGSRPIRMCCGPPDSILVLSFKERDLLSGMDLSRLDWESEQQELVPAQNLEITDRLLGMSYIVQHDILVCVYENEGVAAVRLDNEMSVLWRLSEEVDRLPVKPDSITCDTDGNAYVGDGTRNRIIKIDSFTGDVINVLQLAEENQRQIRSLFWSQNEPSLTVVRKNTISTHYIPQPE